MQKWLLRTVLACSVALTACGPQAEGYGNHPKAAEFIDNMVNNHGFDRGELQALLAQAERKQSIIDAMSRPAEKVKPWHDYRKIFIQERRIDLGAEFWRANRVALAKVEQQYGVDPAIIVAIIGVETVYGRNTGSYRVIDALATLAFDYPRRSPFFTKELEQFLLLTREQKQNPLALTGSYAGAMGYGQFMPSSYRNFSADYNGDGFNDIWNNTEDAIASVANYFVHHGWQTGEPVATPARGDGFDSPLLNKLEPPSLTLAQYKAQGLEPVASYDQTLLAMPLRLEGDGGAEYWLGFNNFYTITRYNHSHRYAMAVFQLSELIRERVGE